MNFIRKQVPAYPVIYFRIIFGILLIQLISRYFYYDWIGKYFIKPRFLFPHFNWQWLQPIPSGGMYLLFTFLLIIAIFITLGIHTRVSALLFALGFSYQHLLDQSNFLNHYYLVFLFCVILAIIPNKKFGKFNRILRTPIWSLWLVRFQIGVVYIFGSIAKMNSDWLIHAQPLKIWLLMNRDMPYLGSLLRLNFTPYIFSYGGLLFDLFIFPLLLFPRTRKWAYLFVLFFHIITFLLFPIGMFPWIMIFLTPVCFSNRFHYRLMIIIRNGMRKFTMDLHGLARMGRDRSFFIRNTFRNIYGLLFSSAMNNEKSITNKPRWAGIGFWSRFSFGNIFSKICNLLGLPVVSLKDWNFYLTILFCGLQIILPLRHFAFPGNLLWTEEGFRFSWHIMAGHKSGLVNFYAGENEKSKIPVSYTDILTQRQLGQMKTDPAMIWQFAKFIHKQEELKGRKNFGVYAESYVSLNGRKAILMINPNVDLNSVEYEYFAHTKWILPLEENID